jgi:imidazolonepropionase-like amidohydrolase
MTGERRAYRAAWVIDPVRDKPWEDAAVVVEDGIIVEVLASSAVPANVRVEDLGQAAILPGIIDAHVHLMFDASGDPLRSFLSESDTLTAVRTVRNAVATLANGVTTVRDLGGPTGVVLAARDAVKLGLFPGPTIVGSGCPIAMTGGHVHQIGLEVDGPDEALKATRELIKSGVDCVKVMASGGIYSEGEETGAIQLSVAEMAAVVSAAHNAGRRVAAHTDSAQSIENALDAGVDTIEHGLFITEPLLNRMAQAGVYFVPTMSVYRRMAEAGQKAGTPRWALDKLGPVVEVSTAGFELALRTGVRIAAGSDTGSPCHEHNSIAYELEMMVELGMSALDAIRAATRTAAEAIGVADMVGTLQPGMRADLTVVHGNPLDDFRAIRQVALVVKNGRPFTPRSLTDLGLLN